MEMVKRSTLTKQVCESIKAYIERNGLGPGDRLPSEKDYIKYYKVSRTVIREALKSLELIGIVQIKPGDGIYVHNPSLQDLSHHISFHWQANPKTMMELYETRRILELGAIEMTIQHYDPSLIKEMESWILKMEDKLHQELPALEEDFQFHRALFRATGNEILFQLSEVLVSFFKNISSKSDVHLRTLTANTLKEHKRIYDCIVSRDVEGAQESMRNHLSPLEALFHHLETANKTIG